ncbi:MAG: hydratase, partial [Firmicutes bacterium]|nr:hydratase [Bacillota bacterium]
LSVYPASQPQFLALVNSGAITTFMESGATVRSAFCGPCFGAGDVPANNGLSIRHCTSNFPNREGAKPANGQMAYVALMDARSIAATARNGGRLTGADELADAPALQAHPYVFEEKVYQNRVYNGWNAPKEEEALVFGPNIADWPKMIPLPENLALSVASAIYDPVTTTDELIPSGETSSYRSNPLKLAEFALSRKDPGYVGRAKAVKALEEERRAHEGDAPYSEEAARLLSLLGRDPYLSGQDTGLGTVVFALKPGDGSAREQAASCQRVLGGCANIAAEYATRRYRANLINWGMIPFILDDAAKSDIQVGDAIVIPNIRKALLDKKEEIPAVLCRGTERRNLTLRLPGLSDGEREILLSGCLINNYAGL